MIFSPPEPYVFYFFHSAGTEGTARWEGKAYYSCVKSPWDPHNTYSNNNTNLISWLSTVSIKITSCKALMLMLTLVNATKYTVHKNEYYKKVALHNN